MQNYKQPETTKRTPHCLQPSSERNFENRGKRFKHSGLEGTVADFLRITKRERTREWMRAGLGESAKMGTGLSCSGKVQFRKIIYGEGKQWPNKVRQTEVRAIMRFEGHRCAGYQVSMTHQGRGQCQTRHPCHSEPDCMAALTTELLQHAQDLCQLLADACNFHTT